MEDILEPLAGRDMVVKEDNLEPQVSRVHLMDNLDFLKDMPYQAKLIVHSFDQVDCRFQSFKVKELLILSHQIKKTQMIRIRNQNKKSQIDLNQQLLNNACVPTFLRNIHMMYQLTCLITITM